MSKRELDDAVIAIVSEPVDDKIVREAAGRVFSHLFDSHFIAGEQVEKIRTCADVQSLIPAYRAGALSRSRALLVEDHVLGCLVCRRVLHPQNSGSFKTAAAEVPVRRVPHLWAYALAASLVLGIAVGVTGAMRGILPGQHKLQATVESVQGSLYRVTDYGASMLEVGAIIRNADELKTAKGSRAMLRLSGGARLELGERSEVNVTSAWHGSEVNLERGRMIVQADNSAQQSFFISAGDVVIPIHGAVVAVNRGTKGSRISVAKGSTEIERGSLRNALYAGQQFATSRAVYQVPLASEFDWSENASQYSALVGQLSGLQKDLEAIPSRGLRYDSALANYLPGDTVVYGSIPNLGATLTQAKQLFDARLADSDVLRRWWQQQRLSQDGRFDRVISQVSSVSGYLGEEIALGLVSRGSQHDYEPVLLAEIRQPGLAQYIRDNLPADAGIQIVGAFDQTPTNAASKLLVRLDHNILVASTNGQIVEAVETAVQNGGRGGFPNTPLFNRVKAVYGSGAGYFVAADLEQIAGETVVHAGGGMRTGFESAKFLVLERKDVSGVQQTRASLSFAKSREGVASVLAAPGPIGSLEFVSPDASVMAAVVMRDPKAMVRELIYYGSQAGGVANALNDFEHKSGVSLINDIAAPLGGDLTFAIDGPGMPMAAWKLAIEVYDPERLKSTIAVLVDRFNLNMAAGGAGTLQLVHHPVGGLEVFAITPSKAPGFSFTYTFVDGYLVAAASEGNLMATIKNKRTGQTLANSNTFRSKLPADRYTNFSGVLYHNVANALKPISDQMNNTNVLSTEQKQTLAALSSSGAGMICLYGESDSITAASSGSFLGFNLGTLAGLYQGEPVAPLIAGNTGLLNGMRKN